MVCRFCQFAFDGFDYRDFFSIQGRRKIWKSGGQGQFAKRFVPLWPITGTYPCTVLLEGLKIWGCQWWCGGITAHPGWDRVNWCDKTVTISQAELLQLKLTPISIVAFHRMEGGMAGHNQSCSNSESST